MAERVNNASTAKTFGSREVNQDDLRHNTGPETGTWGRVTWNLEWGGCWLGWQSLSEETEMSNMLTMGQLF